MPQQPALKPASLIATAIVIAAVALTAQQAHACGLQQDFLVRADPLLASVRPVDCATLVDGPAEFSWPMQAGKNTYTVALHFPDGHTETRDTRSNWLAWGPLPAGEYMWRVSVAGARRQSSDSRIFRMEAPRRPATVAKEGAPPPPAADTRASSPAANLFRLEPSESWIPSGPAPKRASRPSVGGFFGGFTE